MMDFFSSDAGHFASLSKQFLEGALTLDLNQRDKGRILFRPTLALAGQGLELMLKACVCWNGQAPVTRGRAGHNIEILWDSDICEPVRRHVYANANVVAEEDRMENFYPDVPKEDEILSIIKVYVIALGKLHGEPPYALRYPAAPEQMAPRTPLLVKSLWRASDDFVKRPRDFLLPQLE